MTTVGTIEKETGPLIPHIESRVLPSGCKLVPGLNSIYELELAIAEANVLTRKELVERSAYFATIDGKPTNHFELCSGLPLQIGKASFRLRAFFEVYRFKTSYATHGLFPYRGKFHPQLIKAIMNLIGLKVGDIVLDPMSGSGTTNIEASLIGIDSIGFDMNPFAVFMAKTKADALSLNESQIENLEEVASSVFDRLSSANVQRTLLDTATGQVINDEIPPLLLLAYLDALGYSKRVKNKTLSQLLPIVLNRYLAALSNFVRTRDRLGLSLGAISLKQGDARRLAQIESDSIDGIVTSPPYSFAIDYLKGDSLQLEFLGYDLKALRESMIGLRSSGLKAQVFSYLEDMDKTLAEMSRVLKPNRFAVVVIGSNSVQLSKIQETVGIRLEDEMIQSGANHGLRLVQKFERPIEGVQNVMRSEHILFLKKN